MQIDVLSQNTLKLTLSRLDMFDLDIKYESLSGKNPDTKRLLSQVLRTVKLDKSSGVDFSGERLFVEAFPRPDGGCMLYISSLTEDSKNKSLSHNSIHNFSGGVQIGAYSDHENKRTIRLSARNASISHVKPPPDKSVSKTNGSKSKKSFSHDLLCRFSTVNELKGACKSLSWLESGGKITFDSALYSNQKEYRLHISSDNGKLVNAIVSEYGELLNPEHELATTCEYYNLLVCENAVEKMNSVL
ncbi:MAG: adaptor protein MecA [Oscillospiraceae bacterium]|nr:adaptor protein MecA [Oscillospiraceae bacterium]